MKNVVRYSLLTFVLFLYMAAAFAQKGALHGTVSGLDAPLKGATVTAGTSHVLTDKKGWFSFSLDAGTYTLIITHAGYKKAVQEVMVTGDTQTIHVRLSPVESLGEVVILGSRSVVQRSNLLTPVAVDVFSAQQLVQTAQPTLTQMLQFSVPSFNASRPLVNEPVTLRGLAPDQLLILVNGTRRHSMAYIPPSGLRGILGQGSVANDLNAIPFSAVERLEILRDGASAQYGSDAIAGVINIVLKKSTDKTSVQWQTGQFYKGDGENFIVGINRGIALNKKGHLNFSADIRHSNPTYRGGEYRGTVYTNNKTMDDSIVRARAFDRNKVSNAGSSKHTRGGILLNGGYPIGQKTELFWTAAANHRKTQFISGYTFPKNTNRVNPELFPDGFGARTYHNTVDLSGIAGAKGETKKGWNWEYSTVYGNNRDRYFIKNTNNPSQYFTLGKAAPTSFYTGTLVYGQLTNNLHLSKKFLAKQGRTLHLGAGAEWRLESFGMKEGEEGSWKNYDPSGKKGGGSTGLIVPPEGVVDKSRNTAGTYVDVEWEFADRFLLQLASRYEHYSDFGGNLAGKIAARYRLSEKFSVRSSLNNGFRAPSLQQRYYSSTNRTVVTIGGVPTPTTNGLFRNDHEVANAFGAPSLQAERSVNGSFGATTTIMNNIRLTVDAYWIQIRNRIVLSGAFDRRANREVDSLLSRYRDVDRVQFFVNAINTTTRGLDVVLNGNWKVKGANLVAMLAANFTQTRLFGEIKKAGKLKADSLNTATLFSREEKGKLEQGQPASKIILSLQYKTNKFGVMLRNTRFGETAIFSINTVQNPDEHFSSKILTDLSVSYTPKSWLSLMAGANNVFNVYPDPIKDYRNTQEGIYVYAQEASPFGFYGGYYFIGLQFTW